MQPETLKFPPPYMALHDGARRRLARQLRDAHRRALPSEADQLHLLERLVRCEALCVFEAQELLRAKLREMHERQVA